MDGRMRTEIVTFWMKNTTIWNYQMNFLPLSKIFNTNIYKTTMSDTQIIAGEWISETETETEREADTSCILRKERNFM